MARVFVRLKLSLLANGFRRGWQQTVGIIVSAVYVLPLALLGARAATHLGRRSDPATVAEPVLVVGFAVLWLVWIIGPLLAFGMDETLDPARLRLLPLRRRQLMTGLLAASIVGIGPLATVILLYGVLLGFVPPDAGALVVVAAAVVQLLLCVTAARAITTALSRRLSSRRGRDLVTVAAAMVGLTFVLAGQAPRLLLDAGTPGPTVVAQLQQVLATAASALAMLPPGWAARAVGAAARGDTADAVAWLLAAAAAAAALLWWWAAGLERAFDTAPAAGGPRREADLFPVALRWLPRTRLGAGIAKDVRYAWRVPQLRVQYLMLAVLLAPAGLLAATTDAEPAVVLLAPLVLLLVGTAGFNLYGADRGAVWLLDATGPDPRTDLLAKSAAAAMPALSTVALLIGLLAAVTGGWELVVPGLLVALGVHGIVAAVGLFVSVTAPFPLPHAPTNLFAANAGAGCTTVLLQGAGLLVELLLAAPVAVGVALAAAAGTAPLLLVATAAAGWGAGWWWLSLTVAAGRLSVSGPEFIEALHPRTG